MGYVLYSVHAGVRPYQSISVVARAVYPDGPCPFVRTHDRGRATYYGLSMSDYFFPFFYNDYYGGTLGFTWEMHGAYIAALTEQYQHGHFSDEWALSVFGQLWSKINHKFAKDDQGKWFNNRMEEIANHRDSISDKRKQASFSRWSKKNDANAMQMNSKCNANLITSSSSNSCITDLEEGEVQGEEETVHAAPAAPEPPSWRTDYQIYLKEAEAAFDELESDLDWLEEMRHFHPGVYVRRTLQRMWTQYWGTEEGWRQKKSKRTKEINWKSTVQKTFSLSAVRIPRGEPDDEGKWIEVMRKCAVKSRMEVVQ